MNEYTIIALFIAWYVLSMVVSEYWGKRKKIGVEWSFFLSFIFSPVVGFLVTYFSKDSVHAKTKKRKEKEK